MAASATNGTRSHDVDFYAGYSRFEIELEVSGDCVPCNGQILSMLIPLTFYIMTKFVQSLSNPLYLQYLASQKYLEDEEFIAYLEYLQYFQDPKYLKYLQ